MIIREKTITFVLVFTKVLIIMQNTKEKIKFPENLRLKKAIAKAGQSVTYVAKKIGYSRVVVSNTINGHYKGSEVVRLIEKHLTK